MSEQAQDFSRARRRTLAVGGAVLVLAGTLAVLIVAVRPRRPRHARATPAELPATVTAQNAELKRTPSADAPAIARLSRGARVTVLADQGRWLQVRTEKKDSGFLTAGSVETDADREVRHKRAEKIFSFPPVFGVVAEETDILLSPFPLGPQAGRLRRGDTIAIHAVDHDYYAFRASDGGLAFARSSDVDLVPPDPRRPAILPEAGKAPKDLKVSNLVPSRAPAEPSETLDFGAETSVRASAEERPAELISKVDPPYPEAARRAGVEGTVVLDARIDETGSVTDIQVLRGLPLGVSEAAVGAVGRWKYRPALGKDGPVPSHKTIRVVFQLGP